MEPGTVEHDVISNSIWFHSYQRGSVMRTGGTRNLQPNKAVVVGAISENKRAVRGGVVFDSRHYVLRICAGVLRTPLQGRDSRIAGRYTLPFGRQKGVGGAGADNDPVSAVAGLGAQSKSSGEGCACLDLDRVATTGVVQCGLQIASGTDRNDTAGRWRVRQRACYRHAGEFRGTIEAGFR